MGAGKRRGWLSMRLGRWVQRDAQGTVRLKAGKMAKMAAAARLWALGYDLRRRLVPLQPDEAAVRPVKQVEQAVAARLARLPVEE